nr:MAG TPA: hypothetical protein [Caudoviricetes sp.]
MYQHGGTNSDTMVIPLHARGEVRRYNMSAIINKKIIEFGANNALNIIGQYSRFRKNRDLKYYTITTDREVYLGKIKPDCSYEQFLEQIAIKAISEAERLYDLNEEMEREYRDLWDDYEALKEETTNDN